MAVRKGEDSKQGLIIALVIMFLLCIGLGVAAYYGFDGQTALASKVKDAEAKKKSADTSRDWEKYQNLLLKVYIGHPLAGDQDALNTFQDQYETGSLGKDERNKADFDALVVKLREPKYELGWDPAKKLPVNTFFARCEALETQTKEAKDAQAKAEAAFNKKQTELKRDVDDLTKERDTLKQTVKDLNEKKIPDLITQYQKNKFFEMQQREQVLLNDVDEYKKAMDRSKDEAKKAAEKLTKDLEFMKLENTKLHDQLKPLNVLDYDRPKGKILSVERSASVVYIDLGSSDHAKPQLTFSIYGAGSNGLASHQRKGAVEITKVLGPHISQARVTALTDSNRDPVLTGDLLFNPAWNSSLRQHVAVAGLIDLMGDGSNNTEEFVRTLRDQGIVVDAYLDLKNMTIKTPEGGEGISPKTQFLVLGDQPEANADFLTTDIRTEKKAEMRKMMGKLRGEATQLGVTVVPYRRFLSVIGYPMPRVLASRPGSSYLESPLLGKERKEPAKEGGKDKGAKEPKEKAKEPKEAEKDKEK